MKRLIDLVRHRFTEDCEADDADKVAEYAADEIEWLRAAAAVPK